jgi:hypothetical protein
VSLCQATLSIGPYLLLKVQFQHHHYSPDVPGLEPENERLDQQDVGTELPLSMNCREEVFSETELPVYGILGNSICDTTDARKPYI